MRVPDRLGDLDADAPAQLDSDDEPTRGDVSQAEPERRVRDLSPSHPSSPRYGVPALAAEQAKATGGGRERIDGEGRTGEAQRESRTGSSPPGGPPDQPQSPEKLDYWKLVPSFKELWQKHLQCWPRPERSGEDLRRPGDAPGCWRGEGDRYLTPEQNAEAEELVAALHAPEKSITATMRRIEQENPFGAKLVGLEHRLKDTDRLKEKIADKITFKGVDTVADAVAGIPDAIRYTFCLGRENYVSGYRDICERLEAAGYGTAQPRNHWLSDPFYKGVNTRWMTPEGGKFELQFHTPESFHAKEEITHDAYERDRSLDTSRAERRDLEAFQRTVSAAVPMPEDVGLIRDVNGARR